MLKLLIVTEKKGGQYIIAFYGLKKNKNKKKNHHIRVPHGDQIATAIED